eukprot:CAMPEP_0205939858 /NCGR_PEP_ID=MMETSP1325-20131115/50851_1 /ASSEMBLY_ACC=CAM_ASM_000708 /TAXON_ID=236786 /ORGANISM="Florenciella sp., Strain RCC1007" /LENGTH=32 /DNA_ID= /DNA_START= /DNA_END= /DNA_ORIENTATION=
MRKLLGLEFENATAGSSTGMTTTATATSNSVN